MLKKMGVKISWHCPLFLIPWEIWLNPFSSTWRTACPGSWYPGHRWRPAGRLAGSCSRRSAARRGSSRWHWRGSFRSPRWAGRPARWSGPAGAARHALVTFASPRSTAHRNKIIFWWIGFLCPKKGWFTATSYIFKRIINEKAWC